jgi:hypothetical protein
MESLLPVIAKNPNKSKVPLTIAMPGENDSAPVEESTENQYGVEWARLNPPGPVSLWLWSTNAVYRAGSEAQRRQTLSEAIVELQRRVQNGDGQFGRKWSKSKISDALGMTVENASEENFEALERAVSVLCGVQWIRMNENERKLTCVPEDLRLWTADKPILWTRERYRSAGEIQGNFGLKALGKWISDREDDKWTIEYPVAEGTMDAMKAAYAAFGYGIPSTNNPKGRILKDDYARALGKVQAIRHLARATG